MVVAVERRPWLDDALLLFAFCVVLVAEPSSALTKPLALGICLVTAWGYATLHVPSRVEITAEEVSFSRYGRTHVFAWREVERVRLRRFLVKDRVLVRLTPSSPWRGRYWLRDSLKGYEAVVREIESRCGAPVPG
jgi:hypothetical protein